METKYFIIPGLGNSGPNHWQTHLENLGDHYIRIEQNEWEKPNCEDWINNIEAAVSKYNLHNVILIGHSLGCTTIAHWAKKFKHKIKGALLVAPSDIEAPVYIFEATGFVPIPLDKLNFKTIVVTSENDVWVSLERAKYFAEKWGSELINIGNAEHINADSGFGEWKECLEILKEIEK